ncbi:MAG: hypothetical protein JOY96_06330, partial [Verrucomicrobia bacterium]|nr:hypothetical protein [Verrucomicrobiota bacterium]
MRYLFLALLALLLNSLSAQEELAARIVHLPLNQNEPVIIRVGTRSITTLEFPTKIEALDGYGFGVSPAPEGPDLFQISFSKGTNFLSVKALHEGAEGNLSVILDSKVYSLLCRTVSDPSFAVIFQEGRGKVIVNPQEVLARNKEASPARILGFLDKVKGYPALKVSAPEMVQELAVSEPNSDSSVEGLEIKLRRVIRDDVIDSIGFELELTNKTTTQFFYDPEGFFVRVGDEVYPQAVSDAGGIVPPGKKQAAFFIVSGNASGGRNDLAVTNKFEVGFRQVRGEMDQPHGTASEGRESPGAFIGKPVDSAGVP